MLNLTKQEKIVLLFAACAVIFGIALSRIQKNNPRFSNFIDTSAAFKPRPSGRGKVTSLSINPEHTPGFSPGRGERVDFKLKKPQAKINLNQAALKELTDIPGVGDVLAGRIIEYRDVYGGFKDIEEVKKVKGIGRKKFESMKERLIVE